MATIQGNSAHNNLLGTNLNDLIYGYEGNDTLNGGSGADTLIGGTGNDTYLIDNVGDQITEFAGGGVDTVHALLNYTLGEYLNNLTLIGTSSINGTGNEYDNVVIGNSGNNILSGGDGNDQLTGSLGSDTLIGGNGLDQVVETGNFSYILTNTSLATTTTAPSTTTATVSTASTAATFSSNTPLAIADYSTVTSTLGVSGLGGNITDLNVLVNISHTWNSDLRVFLLSPSSGKQVELFSEVGLGSKGFINTLFDDQASKSITSGSGTFTGMFRPESKLSTFDGSNPNGSWKLKIIDAAQGDTGKLNSWALTFNSSGGVEPPPPPPPASSEVDTLQGIEGANLTGGNSNNKLDATAFTLGSVTLNGGLGDDTLIGGGGSDILIGGNGSDILTGGKGADHFTYNAKGEGIDLITDFSGVDDTIAISAAGFAGGLTAGAALGTTRWIVGTAATTASHRLIYNSANGNLLFDPDGNGANAPIGLATLNGAPTLSNNDILVTV